MSLFDELLSFIRRNLTLIIIFAVFFICGFITGIFLAARVDTPEQSFSSFNFLLSCRLIGNMNIIVYFFLRIALIIAVILVLMLCSFSVYLIIVSGGMILFIGLSCGGPIVLMFRLFGLGSIVADIIWLPFELLFAVYFILMGAYFTSVAIEKRKYGCFFDYRAIVIPLAKQLVLLAALTAVQAFLMFVCAVFIT